MIPATDFLVTGLPAIGSIQSFCKCRVRLWLLAQLNKDVFLCRTAVRWSLRSQCSQTRSRDCVEYSRKQHRSPREGTLPQQLNTLSRMIHERRGASFMPYAGFSNLAAIYGEMTCLWWQLIHDFTFHIIRLSVKKCCFEIKLEKIPTITGSLEATYSKSWYCGGRGIGFVSHYFICPGNLSISIWPFLEEVALLVRLDGEHPSSGQIVLRFHFPHINEIKNPYWQPQIRTQHVLIHQTVCTILVLHELMLLFAHEISSWPSLLLLLHRWPYSVPICFWFDRQLLMGLQFACLNRWFLYRVEASMTAAHTA